MLSAASRVAAIERPRGAHARRPRTAVGRCRSGLGPVRIACARPAGRCGGVIMAAFGGDTVGAVLGAGAAAFGHHGGALAAGVGWWVGFGCRDAAGGPGRHGSMHCSGEMHWTRAFNRHAELNVALCSLLSGRLLELDVVGVLVPGRVPAGCHVVGNLDCACQGVLIPHVMGGHSVGNDGTVRTTKRVYGGIQCPLPVNQPRLRWSRCIGSDRY